MKRIVCTKENKPIAYGLFDGYLVADRLMEGVDFRVSVDTEGKVQVVIDPKDESYLKTFGNPQRWYAMVKKHVEASDEADMQCPDCGGDAELQDDKAKPKKKAAPAPIKAMSAPLRMEDILKRKGIEWKQQ